MNLDTILAWNMISKGHPEIPVMTVKETVALTLVVLWIITRLLQGNVIRPNTVFVKHLNWNEIIFVIGGQHAQLRTLTIITDLFSAFPAENKLTLFWN